MILGAAKPEHAAPLTVVGTGAIVWVCSVDGRIEKGTYGKGSAEDLEAIATQLVVMASNIRRMVRSQRMQ